MSIAQPPQGSRGYHRPQLTVKPHNRRPILGFARGFTHAHLKLTPQITPRRPKLVSVQMGN